MKDITKLIFNMLLLSVPLLAAVYYAAAFPMRYMSSEYTMWREESDYVNASFEGGSEYIADKSSNSPADTFSDAPADTLIVGDSRAKSSLIPAILEDNLADTLQDNLKDNPTGNLNENSSDNIGRANIYNIAIGGSTSIEMYHALKNYLKSHDSPKNIVIIFAPYHFCSIDNWQQTLYYNYLSVGELLGVVRDAARCGGNEAVLYRGCFTDAVSFRLRLPNKYLDAVYQAGLSGRYDENMLKYESVRSDKGYSEFGSDKGNDALNYETHHAVFDSSELILYYYEKLLELCEASGAENVIVAQAPINSSSSSAMHDEFLEGYELYMDEVSNRHASFTVERQLPVYDNKYFGDNNHLNRLGAEKFSEEFAERYAEILNR